MIGYKGFDKNFRCRDMQYEVGKTYHHDGELKICTGGLHFCKNPLEVFTYYPPADSRYALVEVSGNIIEDDNKCCTDELTVMKELSLSDLVEAISEKKPTNSGYCSAATNSGNYSAATNSGDHSVATNSGYCSVATNSGNYSAATNSGDHSVATNSGYCSVATNSGYHSVATNSGDYSAATNSGDRSVATNSGDHSAATNSGDHSVATNSGNCSVATNSGNCSVATNSGYCSVATNSGDHSVAIVTGDHSIAIASRNGKAKGALGCWIVLSEWQDDNIIDVQSFKVDGVNIKPDVFYQLVNGKPVAQNDDNIAD